MGPWLERPGEKEVLETPPSVVMVGDEGGKVAPSVPLAGKLLFLRGAWADHAGDRP